VGLLALAFGRLRINHRSLRADGLDRPPLWSETVALASRVQ